MGAELSNLLEGTGRAIRLAKARFTNRDRLVRLRNALILGNNSVQVLKRGRALTLPERLQSTLQGRFPAGPEQRNRGE